ncbi:ABC transporter, ABC-B family, MDR type [Pseudocercospora fijiensis CIRAD86]|uniref:ABC transporter, ABC-B family, MDR type n=1 Tax=Pseudocercospora fijiensis (strain CIRAD86) TaxID=383855 RepID=M3A7K0_PSEFD|nr:ABC transporter, ABC-B family, MDR type [Pseudocercospora fijiensis CIRAD86]EME80591.1 ABC transporter, ABC-B family, MDR type [Pseudocercospora fijiensis CIRAD86]
MAQNQQEPEIRQQSNDNKPTSAHRKVNLRRILSYASPTQRRMLAITSLISALNGALLPLMNVVFGRIVNRFNQYFAANSHVSEHSFRHEINKLTLYIVYLFIGKLCMSFVSKYVFRHVGVTICASLRKAYFGALFTQPVRTIDELKPGSATYALTTVVTSLQNAIADKLEILVDSLGLIFAAYAVAFWHSWALTLASTSLTLLTLVCYGLIGPAVSNLDRAVIEYDSGAVSEASTALRFIRVVKSLGAEEAMAGRHEVLNTKAWKAGLKKSPYVGALFGLYFFCAYGNVALTFWLGWKLYNSGTGGIGSIGDIVTVLFSLVAIMPAVGGLAPVSISINRAVTGSEMLFELVDAERQQPGGLRTPDVQVNSDIRFSDVCFAYPSRSQVPVLRDATFTIPCGKTTAILGPSGCGKSTIVALLERWYDLSDSNASINSGAIYVGRHNVEELDRQWWRGQVGLVEQESVVFDETIYENVARGLVARSQHQDADESTKRRLVEQACKDAYAHDFIMGQAKGYDTVIGEGGIKLSGGQRQRLAIARCIVKDPALLIFDEATSSIDVHSERVIARAIETLAQNRTTIIVTHRLSTVQKADMIVVLEKGTVVEHGLRVELAEKEGSKYAEMVAAQRLRLGDDEDDDIERDSSGDGDQEKDSAARGPDEKDGGGVAETQEVDGADCETAPKGSRGGAMHGYLRTITRLLYAVHGRRLSYLFVLVGAVGAGGAVAVQSVVVANFIVSFQGTEHHHVGTGGQKWALIALIMMLCVTACYTALGFGSNTLSINVSSSYRQTYLEAMLRQPVRWFDGEDVSSDNLTSRLSNDPQQMQEVSGPNMVLPLVGLFTIISCIAVGLGVGWKLTLVTAVAALPIILIASLTRSMYEKHFEAFTSRVFIESAQHAAENIRGFRTVLALTLERSAIDQYGQLLREHVSTALSRARLVALVFALGNSLEFCCIALTFWYGGTLLATHEYSVLQFMIIYAAVVQGGQMAGIFLSYGPNFSQAAPALNRLVAMCLVQQPDESPAMSSTPLSDRLSSTDSAIRVEIRNLSFTYPSQSEPVLHNLNLSIAAGSYVAIVGPSGCGKTTILSLLQRFYPPSNGEILLDNIPLHEIPNAQYRSLCALVSQEPALFHGTVRENLTLGLPNAATTTTEMLESACRAAEVHDFISTLPSGYDTELSAAMHASMSGGQKQRVCIARALLRRPRLLLLDEATSSLDSENERAIQRSIERMAGTGKLTIVAVAHRLATVQKADRIIVMATGGQVVEEGTHARLLARRGVYWEMCVAQALL